MNYSDAISRAFRTLKSGALWGFVASTYAVIVGLFVVAFALGIGAVGGTARVIQTFDTLSSSRTPTLHDFAPLLVLYLVAICVGLLSVPIAVAQYGGSIHLADEVQAGREARVGGGWAFGFRRFWRVIGVELVVGLITFALFVVAIAPIVALAVLSAKTNGNAGAIVGLVCGGMLLLLALIFGVFMISGLEAIAIRYALIGDRTMGDALSSGWAAFRARFKNVFVFILILIGFALVFSIVQSILNYVLQFALFGSLVLSGAGSSSALDAGALLGRFLPAFAVIYLVELALAAALRLFQISMWTAFFRQMTGLDVPQPRPGYVPPHGYAPGPAPMPPQGYPPATPPPAGYPQSSAWAPPGPYAPQMPDSNPPMAAPPSAPVPGAVQPQSQPPGSRPDEERP